MIGTAAIARACCFGTAQIGRRSREEKCPCASIGYAAAGAGRAVAANQAVCVRAHATRAVGALPDEALGHAVKVGVAARAEIADIPATHGAATAPRVDRNRHLWAAQRTAIVPNSCRHSLRCVLPRDLIGAAHVRHGSRSRPGGEKVALVGTKSTRCKRKARARWARELQLERRSRRRLSRRQAER